MPLTIHKAREERGEGVRLDDAQRVARHYGVTIEEACVLLGAYSAENLLPERGYGLTGGGITRFGNVEIVGHTADELASGLVIMEGSMDVGEKAQITLCTKAIPTDEDLAMMYLGMVSKGCHLSYPTAHVTGGIPATEFVLQKGSPAWALIIPILVPLFTVGLVAFGITKIETITKALVPIILISVGGLIILAAVLAKPATKYLEKGGKLPLLPSTEQLVKKAVAVS